MSRAARLSSAIEAGWKRKSTDTRVVSAVSARKRSDEVVGTATGAARSVSAVKPAASTAAWPEAEAA